MQKIMEIAKETQNAVIELLESSHIRSGEILVIGCSTSEVRGDKIGTHGSKEVAQAIFTEIYRACIEKDVFLAVQCCEHLNRALVTTRNVLEKYNLEEVTVRPVLHAGGALATTAYENMPNVVVVNAIVAHAGLDIGQTLIGMHLKKVAVPMRLKEKKIGEATLTAARTRPPLIGGERAQYPN